MDENESDERELEERINHLETKLLIREWRDKVENMHHVPRDMLLSMISKFESNHRQWVKTNNRDMLRSKGDIEFSDTFWNLRYTHEVLKTLIPDIMKMSMWKPRKDIKKKKRSRR